MKRWVFASLQDRRFQFNSIQRWSINLIEWTDEIIAGIEQREGESVELLHYKEINR